MKEATGGALLMGLAAGIIVIFVTVVAFFISYGKTFRLKNTIINKIEQSEGMKESDIISSITSGGTKYNIKPPQLCYNKVSYRDINNNLVYKGFTVQVVVYMAMERRILGESFTPSIPVRGETRIIDTGYYRDHLTEMNIDPC